MLQSASDRQAESAALATRAVSEAGRAGSATNTATVVARYQAANAMLAQAGVTAMLAEQGIDAPPEAALNVLSFTTSSQILGGMLESAGDAGFDRVIRALVQDAGRAAETVTVTTRPNVGWIRHLNLPSCARCVVLADRVYKYNSGFYRHPGDDCTTVPVREGDLELVEDPVDLMKRGLIRGLSEADHQALLEGADFGKVVNVRRKQAGLTVAGRVLARADRPTPEGIFAIASDRPEAIRLMRRYRYLL